MTFHYVPMKITKIQTNGDVNCWLVYRELEAETELFLVRNVPVQLL
jgi:hypothetical protein